MIAFAARGLESAPKKDLTLGFNIARAERNPNPDNPKKPTYEIQQWAVTFAGNCAPKCFGTVIIPAQGE